MVENRIDYLEAIKKAFSNKKAASIGILLYVVVFALGALSQAGGGAIIAVLSIVSLFLSIIFLGYGVKIMNNEGSGNDELPDWEGIPELFILGLKSLIVLMTYMIPILVVVATLTLIIFFGLISSLLTDPYGVTSLGYFGVWMVVCLLLVVFVGYFALGALANFANSYSVMDAFDFKTVKEKVLSINYLIPFVVLFFMLVGINLVSIVFTFFIGSLMVLPVLISSILSWVSFVLLYGVIGKAYNW